jgi:hypothetical protein
MTRPSLLERQLSASSRAHHFFPEDPSERHYPAWRQPAAVSASRSRLERPQPLGFGHIHPAELGLPFVDAGVADAVLAAQIDHRKLRPRAPSRSDDLLFLKRIALLLWSLSWATANFKLD